MTRLFSSLATLAFLLWSPAAQTQNNQLDPDADHAAQPPTLASPTLTKPPLLPSGSPPTAPPEPGTSSPNTGLSPVAPPSVPGPVLAAPGGVQPTGTSPLPNITTRAAPPAALDTINNAKLDDTGEKDGVSPAILRAEVMLDRLHASPGVIDGRSGSNFEHALEIYKKTEGMKVNASLDKQVWSALTAESGTPVLMEYVLTDQDVQGPYYPNLPSDYAQLATLPAIGYRTPSQKIAAKFHMGETLLAALNPGIDLSKSGAKILVANVMPKPLHQNVFSIVVDKINSQVLGFDHKGMLLVAYPATIGSQELPSPSGTYKVKGVAYNPVYYYDPKNFLQGNNKGKLKLPPGPNNPVGSVFIALTKPTYGLHGTPDPSKIDKATSHGCVRMTNWNANELAHLVKRGVVVRFRG